VPSLSKPERGRFFEVPFSGSVALTDDILPDRQSRVYQSNRDIDNKDSAIAGKAVNPAHNPIEIDFA
jgi:hypothetical protein